MLPSPFLPISQAYSTIFFLGRRSATCCPSVAENHSTSGAPSTRQSEELSSYNVWLQRSNGYASLRMFVCMFYEWKRSTPKISKIHGARGSLPPKSPGNPCDCTCLAVFCQAPATPGEQRVGRSPRTFVPCCCKKSLAAGVSDGLAAVKILSSPFFGVVTTLLSCLLKRRTLGVHGGPGGLTHSKWAQ